MNRRDFLSLSLIGAACATVAPYALSQESDVKRVYEFVRTRGRADDLGSLGVNQYRLDLPGINLVAFEPVKSSQRFDTTDLWTKPVLFIERDNEVLRDYGLDGLLVGEGRDDYFEQEGFRFIGNIDKYRRGFVRDDEGNELSIEDAMDMLPEAKRRYKLFLSEFISELGI